MGDIFFIWYKPKDSIFGYDAKEERIIISDGTQYSSYIGKSAFEFDFSEKRIATIQSEKVLFVKIIEDCRLLPKWFLGVFQQSTSINETPKLSIKKIRQKLLYDI